MLFWGATDELTSTYKQGHTGVIPSNFVEQFPHLPPGGMCLTLMTTWVAGGKRELEPACERAAAGASSKPPP